MSTEVQQLDRVVIRLAGDSGDGMQLTGDRFTRRRRPSATTCRPCPNFPAEIRAPAGTLPGVSSFQLHFADHDILTPGDRPDVLVAMNPAALKANLGDLPGGGMLIVDTDEFTARDLAKVGYAANPLEDGSLDAFTVHALDLPADPRRARRHRACPARTPSAPRTCSPSACCPGCTTGPPRAPCASCARSSRRSPRSPRPTSRRSGPAATTARPPRPSRSPTRSSRPRWPRAPTATSPATWRWPTA